MILQDDVDLLIAASERLARHGITNTEELAVLHSKVAHLKTRLNANLKGRAHRLPLTVKELLNGRYHRFSNGGRSAARDLLW
jgi:hypothetical protein